MIESFLCVYMFANYILVTPSLVRMCLCDLLSIEVHYHNVTNSFVSVK